jgi:hypothetical protein
VEKHLTATRPICSKTTNIKRGEDKNIQDGDSRIIAGDYLNILTSEKRAHEIKHAQLQMAGIIMADSDDSLGSPNSL